MQIDGKFQVVPLHSSWFGLGKNNDLCYLSLKTQQILWFAAVSFWEVFFQVDMKEKKEGILFLGMLISARPVCG